MHVLFGKGSSVQYVCWHGSKWVVLYVGSRTWFQVGCVVCRTWFQVVVLCVGPWFQLCVGPGSKWVGPGSK